MSTASDARLSRNNFDLLRLLFASTVCLTHAYVLSGFAALEWIDTVFSASVAVKAFFVVSGFLIFMSYERSSTLGSYARKRVRRIYPAYFTIVMVCAIGLVAVSSRSIVDYFFSIDWLEHTLSNLAFLNFVHPALPDVFEDHRVTAVNGALWTLKIEVMFYLSVPLFVYLFRRYSPARMLPLFYLLSVTYAAWCTMHARRTGLEFYEDLAKQLPGQLSYFMAGGFFYYYLPLFVRRVAWFVVPAAIVLALDTFRHPAPMLEPFALATIVVFFGLFLYVGNFGKYGDFSYGVYIVHFPIIQVLLWSGWFDGTSPMLYLATVIALTALAGVTMWHLVEKRFLLRSSHYIAASDSPELVPTSGSSS
jgi:peptidoglycan/LPS O-acetylase OafA/YrhL